jgi:hypothetical protein
MAKHRNRSNAGAGRSMAQPEGNEAFEVETGELGEQREDSESGDRAGGKEETVTEESASFPIGLIYPDEPIVVYEHFAKALNDFQRKIYHSDDEIIKHLTITQATLDAPVVPEVHHSPYCGYPIVKGEGFSVRLSNGQIVEASQTTQG